MSRHVSFDESAAWFVLRRLDENDERVLALRRVSIPSAAEVSVVAEMIAHAFGLSSLGVVLKIRNHRGRLIPLNSSIPANSKHRPHVLEVTRFFQHLHPKPRTVPVAVINSSMKTRLQAVDHRVQRLDDLLPQVKLQHDDRLTQELRSLDLKLKFLYRRMEVADSHSWKGMLSRAPLW